MVGRGLTVCLDNAQDRDDQEQAVKQGMAISQSHMAPEKTPPAGHKHVRCAQELSKQR